MQKKILIAIAVFFVIIIASGYRGGAKDATGNYHSVMTGR